MKYFLILFFTVFFSFVHLYAGVTELNTTCAVLDQTQDDGDEYDVNKSVNIDSLRIYLVEATSMEKSLRKELKKATVAKADAIYNRGGYRFDETDIFSLINRLVTPALVRWGNCGGEAIDIQDKEVFTILEKAGLEAEYLGEGYAELITNPYFYYHIFEPYVSAEVRDFMEIKADNDHLISADAGLIVPLDMLAEKSIKWENYLSRYPNSNYRSTAISQYGTYMGLIMLCTYDNTPAFDYQTGKMNDWVLEEIESIVQTNTDNETITILKHYLTELEKQDFKYSKELENKIMNMGFLKEFDRTYISY